MKEYDIVATYHNACGGAAHPQRWLDEAQVRDPADYIREKHGYEFERFVREERPDGRIVYTFDNGAIAWIYEFTEV